MKHNIWYKKVLGEEHSLTPYTARVSYTPSPTRTRTAPTGHRDGGLAGRDSTLPIVLHRGAVPCVHGVPCVHVVGAGVDLLFCNEEEAMLYTDKDNLSEAREALKKAAKRFVITLGEKGAMIFDGDTFIDIEPYKAQAIDTNGAGDLFAGAFLYGITNGKSYADAGKIASLASSQVVTQFGPRLERDQAKEILNKLN